MTTLIRASLLLTIAFTLIGCSTLSHHPYIRVGATRTEIHQGIENGRASLNLYQGKNQDPNLRVHAGFEKDVCSRIKYSSVDNRKISDHVVSVVLCLNSRGVAWIVQESPVNEGKVYFKSVDGKYRAILTNKRELFIVTEKLWQKSLRELKDEHQQSKATISSQP